MIYALKLLAAVFLVACVAMRVFRPAFDDIFSPTEYKRIWTLVIGCIFATYLCKFPQLFMLAVSIMAIYGAIGTGRGPVGKISIFLLLACVFPPISLSIGGVGGISYVLTLDHLRILSLVLLPWAAVELSGPKVVSRAARFFWVDLLMVAYPCLKIILAVPHSTVTTLLRLLVESTLDILLPYFVVSRGLRSLADIRFAAGHLLVGLSFAASVGVAEALIQTKLYSGLQSIYGVSWALTYQLMRGGLLRVESVAPQPILLAFMLSFGIGLAYWLIGVGWRRPAVMAMFAAFSIALVSTFSRGPWLATAVLLLAIFTARRVSSTVFRALLIVLLVGGVSLKLMGAEEQVISALGAVFGSAEADVSSIEYRRNLLDTSLALIQQSPWFGVPNYAVQMQSLKQGEGIIDIVNSYLFITLDCGVVGLTLYLLPFLIVLHRLISAACRNGVGAEGSSRFAAAFLALMIGCLFDILTTSTWGNMGMFLTLLVSLPLAWLTLTPEERQETREGAAMKLDSSAAREGRNRLRADFRSL